MSIYGKWEKLFLLAVGFLAMGMIGVALEKIRGHNPLLTADSPTQLWAADFLADSRTLVTVAGKSSPTDRPQKGEVVFWDLTGGREKLVLSQHASLRAVSSSSDGKQVATGDFLGAIKLINGLTGTVTAEAHGVAGVNAVKLSPDGKYVVGGFLDGSILVWNLPDGIKKRLTLPEECVLNVAIASDDRFIVATTRSGHAYEFDLSQGGNPKILRAYAGPPIAEPNVEVVAFAADGKSFVTGSQKFLRRWESATGKLLTEFDASPVNVNCAAFLPDTNALFLATEGSDGTLAIWNAAQGKIIRQVAAHASLCFGVAVSPDGKYIATVGRDDYLVKIWDSASLVLVNTLQRTNAMRQKSSQ